MKRIALLTTTIVALAACGPAEQAQETTKVDATKADTSPDTSVSPDVSDPDAVPIDGTLAADGLLQVPSGTAAGWVVLNRFGETTADADGHFTLPVATDGITLTIAYQPEHTEAPLLALTLRVAELETTAPTLAIDVDTTAATLVLVHPRVSPRDAWRLRALGGMAAELASIDALADAIRASFATWRDAAPVRAAYAAAVTELLRRAAPPWDATLAVALPADPEGARVVRSGRAITEVHIKDGSLSLSALPGSPPRFTATLAPLDAGHTSLADVLAGRPVTALATEPLTLSDDTSLPIAEGLYRMTIEADVARNTTLASERTMAIWAPDQSLASTAISTVVKQLVDATPIDSALTADPDHPLAAILDARRGPTSETFTLVVGDPFSARFDSVTLVDERVKVTGRHLDDLVFVDARGRARAATRDTSDLAGRFLTLPKGLVGAVRLRAETPAGLVTSDVITTLGDAPAPVPPPLLSIIDGPTEVARGESARFTIDGAEGVTVTAETIVVPVRIIADDIVVLDTSVLSAGDHQLTFLGAAASAGAPLHVTSAAPTYTRDIAFHALDPSTRATQLAKAIDLANGTRVAHGEFWRRETNVIVTGGWYCPLDIRPDDAVVTPAPTCNHFSAICDDLWIWDDARSVDTWFTVTRPPGRGSSGDHCAPIAGPISWTGLTRTALHDRLTSSDIQYLAGELRGPNAELTLGNVRGGGLRVAGTNDGARNEVVLDLTVSDASGSDLAPVVTLNGVSGVTIKSLRIAGRPTTLTNGCAVGLRIVDSQDVQIDRLVLDQCDRAIEIVDSIDVRLGSAATPIVVTRAKDTALSVTNSADVFVQAQLGFTRPTADTFLSAGTDNIGVGVALHDSERVTLAGAIVATRDDAVRLDGGEHLRVGPLALGFIPKSDGTRSYDYARVSKAGVLLTGHPEDVRISDVVADQIGGDAVNLGGGERVRLDRLSLGDTMGVSVGMRLVTDGYAHDVDIDTLHVGRAEFDAIRIEGPGRSAFKHVVVGDAGACAFSVALGGGVSLSDATLGGRLCGFTASDVQVEDVDAEAVQIEGSEGYRIERAETGHVDITSSLGVALVDSSATDVTISGPNNSYADPVSLIDVTLTRKAGLALSATNVHVPLQLIGVHAETTDLASADSIVMQSVVLGPTTLRGGRLYVGAGNTVAALTVSGGRVMSDDSGLAITTRDAGELVAAGALTLTTHVPTLVALLGATLDDVVLDAGVVVISESSFTNLDLRGAGHVAIDHTAVDGAIRLDGSDGATLADTVAASVALADANDASLARVVAASGITRTSTTRGQRACATLGLAALAGDPSAHGALAATSLHITAAPAHALVELLRADSGAVVARAFASDGEVLFRGLDNLAGLLVQATLLDGTSGPAIALQPADEPACVAADAPSDVREVLARDPAEACEGVAAGTIVDHGCRFAVHVTNGNLMLVELASGAETSLTSDDEARDPVFAGDDASVWFARRALGQRWSLARVALADGVVSDELALPGDALWPGPAPDGSALAFASCPDGEGASCHLAFLDPVSGAVGIPADGGWPAARACDERNPSWLPSSTSAELGLTLVVARRSPGTSASSQDLMSALGLVRWRL